MRRTRGETGECSERIPFATRERAMFTDDCCDRRSPLADADPPIHILLALQGGGALGAFQIGIFEHLHNTLNVGEQIHALSGVSIGALNSAIYVANYRNDPIGALKRF